MAELRTGFHQELEEIQHTIARLGATVVELIPRATQILLDQDLAGAEAVLAADPDIDAIATDAEERALNLLALQAPVAGDLRQVAAALKLAPEIERSADLCGNLCKAARRLYGHEIHPRLKATIQRLSDQAQLEYREVIDAYINDDASRAAAVVDMDEYLDDLHQQFIQEIFNVYAESSTSLEVAVQLAMVARFYERLGDHAVNVSQRVIYIATGAMPEHDAVRNLRDAADDDNSDDDNSDVGGGETGSSGPEA